jgi:hypothetical protein
VPYQIYGLVADWIRLPFPKRVQESSNLSEATRMKAWIDAHYREIMLLAMLIELLLLGYIAWKA